MQLTEDSGGYLPAITKLDETPPQQQAELVEQEAEQDSPLVPEQHLPKNQSTQHPQLALDYTQSKLLEGEQQAQIGEVVHEQPYNADPPEAPPIEPAELPADDDATPDVYDSRHAEEYHQHRHHHARTADLDGYEMRDERQHRRRHHSQPQVVEEQAPVAEEEPPVVEEEKNNELNIVPSFDFEDEEPAPEAQPAKKKRRKKKHTLKMH
jgi:hypothetical protein